MQRVFCDSAVLSLLVVVTVEDTFFNGKLGLCGAGKA